ncbi:kinase phosphorylation protein-domain-containing protein [Xylariaceae sp. FL0016]|nr:kinase phosphorylation protein-domain-containing protein [Xylariaceae sp. FL0016]
MDLVSSIRKSGSRGGVNFNWDDVAGSSHRENYLGHSLKAPVGRWQKGRDLTWYAKSDQAGENSTETAEERAERERKEELRKIKEAEEDALARALGLPVAPRKVTGANAEAVGEGRGVAEGPSAELRASKAPEDDSRRERKRHGDSEKRHRRRHRSRSRSRDRDRGRDRRHHRSPLGGEDSHKHRSTRDGGRDGDGRRDHHRRRSYSRERDPHPSGRGHRHYHRRSRSPERKDQWREDRDEQHTGLRDRRRNRSPHHRRRSPTRD